MAEGASAITVAMIGVGSAVLSAFLTNWLSGRRTLDEKVWELRRVAYGRCLSISRDLIVKFSQSNRFSGESVGDLEAREEFVQLAEQIWALMHQLADLDRTDLLVMSDEFSEKLEGFRNRCAVGYALLKTGEIARLETERLTLGDQIDDLRRIAVAEILRHERSPNHFRTFLKRFNPGEGA